MSNMHTRAITVICSACLSLWIPYLPLKIHFLEAISLFAICKRVRLWMIVIFCIPGYICKHYRLQIGLSPSLNRTFIVCMATNITPNNCAHHFHC